MKYLLLPLLVAAAILAAFTSQKKKVYQVKKTQNDIIVTGYGSDDAWKNANILTEFLYPWQPEDFPHTEFKSLWSDTHFYFLFIVFSIKMLRLTIPIPKILPGRHASVLLAWATWVLIFM